MDGYIHTPTLFYVIFFFFLSLFILKLDTAADDATPSLWRRKPLRECWLAQSQRHHRAGTDKFKFHFGNSPKKEQGKDFAAPTRVFHEPLGQNQKRQNKPDSFSICYE